MKIPVVASLALLALAGCASGPPAGSPPVPEPVELPERPAAPPVEGEDFRVFLADGAAATLAGLVERAGEVEAVLVGEEHDDAVGHRVQLEILRRIATTHGEYGPMAAGHPAREGPGSGGIPDEPRPIVLSLEMFERDVQYVLDEYLDDLITEAHFRSSARPWENYERAYRPLVEFARALGIPVLAANAPRRYVNRVSRLGRESVEALGPEALRYLPPVPWPEASEAYRAEWDALMGGAAMHMQGDPLAGQTLWDAAMGESIARALDEADEGLVLHLAGGFHVENGTGIPETLEHYRPGTRALTVAIRTADTADGLPPVVLREDLEGAADWIVVTRRESGGG